MTTSVDWVAEFKDCPSGSERKELYDRYLLSDCWRATRKAALERAENACQVCNGAERLQVHHRTYDRVGVEREADLIVLCEKCHILFHKRGAWKAAKAKPRPIHRRKSAAAPPRPATMASVDEAIARTQPGQTFTTGMIRNRLRNNGPLPSKTVVRRCIQHRVDQGACRVVSTNRFVRVR